jgi:hypothetical protein
MDTVNEDLGDIKKQSSYTYWAQSNPNQLKKEIVHKKVE